MVVCSIVTLNKQGSQGAGAKQMLCPTSLTYKLVGHSEGRMNKLLHLPLEAEQSQFLMACQKHKMGTKSFIQPI